MNKKILMILAPKDFRDEEYVEPRRALESGGLEVKVASLVSGEARGAGGMTVKIDSTVDQIKSEDFDAILFVGGPGMAELVKDNQLIRLALAFYQAGKLTAAICIAPAILAHAGILKNKKATVWSGASNVLKSAGAIYTAADVEQDGQIITANGPGAADAFGRAVLNSLR